MPTQDERRAATTAAIRAAARRLFADQGFAATSVDAVAEAAGVAKGGVYHHFETKERLFEAVFRAVEDELYERVLAALPRRRSGVEALVAGTRAFMAFCLESDVHQIVLVDGPKVLGWELWREIDAAHFLPLITAGLALEAGPGPRVDSVAHLLIGAIDEAVMVLAADPDPDGALARIRDSLELMIRSVAAALAATAPPDATTGSPRSRKPRTR